jgi:hypothetical protein
MTMNSIPSSLLHRKQCTQAQARVAFGGGEEKKLTRNADQDGDSFRRHNPANPLQALGHPVDTQDQAQNRQAHIDHELGIIQNSLAQLAIVLHRFEDSIEQSQNQSQPPHPTASEPDANPSTWYGRLFNRFSNCNIF